MRRKQTRALKVLFLEKYIFSVSVSVFDIAKVSLHFVIVDIDDF